MNDIDNFLSHTYCYNTNKLSSDSKNKLIELYNNKKRKTTIGKRIFVFNIILALATIIVTPVSVYATAKISNSIYEMVLEKLKNAKLSENEIEEIVTQFENQDNAEDYINNADELNVNENNQTYGPDMWNADLISVISDQGDLGYVYREELYYDGISTLNDAINYNKEVRILNVYSSDGETIIGTFTVGE